MYEILVTAGRDTPSHPLIKREEQVAYYLATSLRAVALAVNSRHYLHSYTYM